MGTMGSRVLFPVLLLAAALAAFCPLLASCTGGANVTKIDMGSEPKGPGFITLPNLRRLTW